MEAQSFKDRFRATIQKFLRPSAYLLLVAFAIYPLIPYEPYKYIALFGFGMVLLRLLLDIDTGVTKRLSDIDSRVKSDHAVVVGLLTDTTPPTWENFRAASKDILEDIDKLIASSTDKALQIDILGVSARYSWPLLEDHLLSILSKPAHSGCKIKVRLAVCQRTVLEQWALTQQTYDLDKTLAGLAEVQRVLRERFESGQLSIELIQFDLLPMWHGVMLGDKILYMGRTRWDMSRTGEAPTLQVGSREYRRFVRQDAFGGNARIEMFNNWFSRLQLRHGELKGRR